MQQKKHAEALEPNVKQQAHRLAQSGRARVENLHIAAF